MQLAMDRVTSCLIQLTTRAVHDVDLKMLRQTFDKDRRRNTVIYPVVATMEVIIMSHLKDFLLHCFGDTEALATFVACEIN